MQKTSPAQDNLPTHGDSMPHTNSKVATPRSPFQLDVLLNVREARDLRSSQPTGHLQHSFLVVRIPWCNEESLVDQRIVYKAKRFHSAISWGSGATPAFHFGLRASAILSEVRIRYIGLLSSSAFICVITDFYRSRWLAYQRPSSPLRCGSDTRVVERRGTRLLVWPRWWPWDLPHFTRWICLRRG